MNVVETNRLLKKWEIIDETLRECRGDRDGYYTVLWPLSKFWHRFLVIIEKDTAFDSLNWMDLSKLVFWSVDKFFKDPEKRCKFMVAVTVNSSLFWISWLWSYKCSWWMNRSFVTRSYFQHSIKLLSNLIDSHWVFAANWR